MSRNLIVTVKGNKSIYRDARDGNVFIRDEPVFDEKIFVTYNDNCLVSGKYYDKDAGNELFKSMLAKAGSHEYVSACGRYRFLNIENCEVSVEEIKDADRARSLAQKFEDAIDPFVCMIDGPGYFSAVEDNERLTRLSRALYAVADELEA